MVLLKATETVVRAVDRYRELQKQDDDQLLDRLVGIKVEDPIEHRDLVALSRLLVHHQQGTDHAIDQPKWRLDTLLTGVTIYIPPPPPKPEPSAEYKALMQRLRNEEEQRQYDRMTEAPQKESFAARLPTGFNPQLTHGRNDIPEIDEVTYQDINRQLTLIINVLVTVIASGVTIWFAARYWAVPQRLSIALIGSFAIAVAEVVVYMGYIRRVQEAKSKEKKKVERKKVDTTWVIEANSKETTGDRDGIRHRKGRHR